MIFSPILNFSELKNHTTVTRHSGTGTVLLDPQSKTVSIKTGSGLITAKYLGTDLHSGDSIRYTLLNDILLIEKIQVPDQTDHTDCFIRQKPTDFNRLTQQIDSLLTGLSQAVSSEKTKQDLFSVLEFLAGLPAKIDPVLVQNISFILQTNGELNSDSTEKLKDLLLQIKQFISNNTSGLLKKYIELPIPNLPGDIYKFEALEDLLSSHQLSKDILSETVTLAKSHDWQYIRIIPCGDTTLASMISTDDLQQELKSLICNFISYQMQSVPVSSLQTIIECRNQLNLRLLNTIDALLANMQNCSLPNRSGPQSVQHSNFTQWLLTTIDNQSILPEMLNRYPSTATSIISAIKEHPSIFPAAENFAITDELLSTINKKEDLIPIIFERLGFNFEHKLSEPGFDLRDKNSLKEIILGKIINFSINHTLPAASETTDLSKFQSELSLFLDNVHNEFSAILKNLSLSDQSALETKGIVQALHESLAQLDFLRKNYFQSDLQGTGIENEIGNALQENFNNKLNALLSDLVIKIMLLQNTLKISEESSSSVLSDQILKFSQKLNEFLENPAIDNKDLRITNFDQQGISFTRDTKESDNQLKPVFNENATLKDLSISSQLSKPPLNSLLNRLESLQLLSRPISTSDGTQQVLALPMNVGGEWTEVNIRLVKKRNGSRKKVHKSFFKVELNVAPSKLGAISVQMEYELKKRFKLRISFDKNQTLEWFSKNRDSLGKSLCNLGLPLVDFQLQPERKKPCEAETAKLSNTVFDVKV
jgi:hypothetical protein